MTRCIVLLKEDVSSRILQANKQEHVVVSHISVRFTCDGRYHTYHRSHFSSCKRSLDENATYVCLESTLLARRIHHFIFVILVHCHRHWISTRQYRQHFPIFLRSSADVPAPTLSVAPCDCGQQKYPRGTMASIPISKRYSWVMWLLTCVLHQR